MATKLENKWNTSSGICKHAQTHAHTHTLSLSFSLFLSVFLLCEHNGLHAMHCFTLQAEAKRWRSERCEGLCAAGERPQAQRRDVLLLWRRLWRW